MPILGNLSEFPLPEVLLLIGARTGRLRLLDVPEFGMMDVDFSNGEIQAMYLGSQTITEPKYMIDKLSAVVQAQGGMFEFRLLPVASVARESALMVNQLVMSLVCHVDELVARQRKLTSPNERYVLAATQPDIWMEPELSLFFLATRQLLALGASLNDLAQSQNMDIQLVHTHMTHLRLLGLVELIDMGDTVKFKDLEVQDKISRKSNEFLLASRVAGELQRISTRLPKIKKVAGDEASPGQAAVRGAF